MPYTRESGATKIQAVWHGYKARQSLVKAPSSGKPIYYQTFVTGNEPREILENRHKINGYFVFVGTSGLTNLHWIKQAVGSPITSADNFTGIPKLYLVDLSRTVESFWNAFKKIMVKSRSFAEFERNVSISRDTFRFCCSNPKAGMGYDIADEIIENVRKLSLDAQGKISEEWYTFLRNVVCKASIICEDWSNTVTFEYIKQMTDPKVPVVIYASNILEYVGNAFKSRTNNAEALVNNILKNIEMLNTVLAIHTRTSVEKSIKYSMPDDTALMPDRVLILDKNNKDHFAALNHPQYVHLVDPAGSGAEDSSLVNDLMSKMLLARGRKVAMLRGESSDSGNNSTQRQKCF